MSGPIGGVRAHWAVLCVVLCLSVYSCEGRTALLNSENFDAYLLRYENVLVGFCDADEVPECKVMVEYWGSLGEAVAKVEDDEETRVAYISMKDSKEIMRTYGVKMPGEVLWFKRGEVHAKALFNPHEPEDMFEFYEAHRRNSLRQVSSEQELQRLIDNIDDKHSTILVYGGSAEDELHQNLLELSHHFYDSLVVGAVYDEHLIDIGTKGNPRHNVWIYIHHHDTAEDVPLEWTYSTDLREMIREVLVHGTPRVIVDPMKTDLEGAQVAIRTKKNSVTVYADIAKHNVREEVTRWLNEVADENERYRHWGIIVGPLEEFYEHNEKANLQHLSQHKLYAIAINEEHKKLMAQGMGMMLPIFWDENTPLNKQTFAKWLDDIDAGIVKPGERSAEEHESDLTGPLKRVVRKQAMDFIESRRKDVLIAINLEKEICGGACILTENAMEELSKSYSHKDQIDFLIIDAMKNDVHDIAPRPPSIVLYTKEGKKYVFPAKKENFEAKLVKKWLDGFYEPLVHDEL